MSKPRILLCMGTRPEIIKMAPVYHALQETQLEPVVVHTGQHDRMAWPLYEFFDMSPGHTVTLTRERPSLGHLGGRIMDEVDAVLNRLEARAVLVHGDTTSALMGGLAAVYAKIPIGHVEAGLRSGDPADPFPEEVNRVLVAQMARWHFAPTHRAVQNLIDERVDRMSIHQVGNTIVDATQMALNSATERFARSGTESKSSMSRFVVRAGAGRLMLVTAHRRENWGVPMKRLARTVREMLESAPDLHVLWPLHANPDVRRDIIGELSGVGPDVAARLKLTEPMPYANMLWALKNSWIALTDSGGIQEEAAALRVPVLVARKTTERPELIEAGGGALVGTDPVRIRRWFDMLGSDQLLHSRMRTVENPYGQGKSGEQIAAILERDLVMAPSLPQRLAA